MNEPGSERRAASGTVDSLSPLTPRQWLLLVALSLFVAATRFLALSHSIWDWDEGLFLSALRHYDVAAHHPHPPGFPLFIATAKFVRLFVHDDFHALRAVSLTASLFVFPLLFAAARSFRFPFHSSALAGLLFSFLPNVWYWGGTAFSDLFSIVLFLAAAALLLRDERNATYLAGSVFFAATLLVRPQNVLLAYPWLLASWRRLRSRRIAPVVLSAAAIAILAAGGYGLAARATGWREYAAATRAHQKYVATVDGVLNPHRPPMTRLFRDFAVDPVLAGAASKVLFAFALLAFVRPRRRDADVVLTFAPNFLLAWFMLSVSGVSRLSLGYIPMHALLAADGMEAVAGLITRRERSVRAIQSSFAALVIVRYVVWLWPGLTEVRRHDSPPMAAIHWIQQHVPPAHSTLYVQGGMSPFTDYYLQNYRMEPVPDAFDPATAPEEPGAYYTADRESPSPYAVNFHRKHKKLWGVFLRRYFESCVVPLRGGPHWIAGGVQYLDGWYSPESEAGGGEFRWMSGRALLELQPLPQVAQLSFTAFAPLDAESPPLITVTFDGTAIDRFRPATATFQRTYRLATQGRPGEVVIETSGVVNPAKRGTGNDDRNLGLRVSQVSWRMLTR